MINLFILLVITYILISVWAYSHKKDLKKTSWFIRNGWEINYRWLWPVSWQGHLLWLCMFVPLPVAFYYGYRFLTGDKRLYMLVVGFLLTFVIYVLATKKSEGYLFKNDKWFDFAPSPFLTSSYVNKDGSTTKPMTLKQFKKVTLMALGVAVVFLAAVIGLWAWVVIHEVGVNNISSQSQQI